MLTHRENVLRNARFQGPEWIPISIGISNASWDQWRHEMEAVALRYPEFFPYVHPGWRDHDHFDFGPAHTKGVPFTDAWGCTWVTAVNGLEGVVTNAPLADWDAFETYQLPDPNKVADRGPVDWAAIERSCRAAREAGHLTAGGTAHGFLFLRLQYLRGFENLMLDMAAGEPRLQRLIDKIVAHTAVIVGNYLRIGVDIMEFADDLGTQTATLIGPTHFRRWIQPAYTRVMAPCKAAGVLVGFHSDGYTLDILEDLVAAGVGIVNPQDLCNGIDNLARTIKGKACIRLDIDRQRIIPFGTRQEIHDHIEEAVRKLGDPRGGLELVCGIYPPTPPENVDALCEAFRKFRTYWWN